jgi:UDP-galactopyranose mutase
MAAFSADYLVVGSGMTGATIARQLFDAGRDVLVLERRDHLGGNVHDFAHPSGVRIHTYGPHYFRTNSDKLWEFANRFADFHPYRAKVRSLVDGRHETWPVNKTYLHTAVGPDWKPGHDGPPANFEEACLAIMPRLVYEKFVRGYTEKQWDIDPARLGKDLAGRFDVREDDEQFFSRHKHQGIPARGYASFMENLLDGIPKVLGFDYLRRPGEARHRKKLVFTGPIDEFFHFELGKLKYRAQKRVHKYFPDETLLQPVGQVNNPDPNNGKHIRTLEWKHMMPEHEQPAIKGTVTTREFPFTPEDPHEYEYPFPDEANRRLYALYRERAASLPDTLICGRLGEYRYYDMDQAMAKALLLARQILDEDADDLSPQAPLAARNNIAAQENPA